MTAHAHAENILTRLHGVKSTPSGWSARCPAHDDKTPSLSIAEGDDGRVLMKCFAGCEPSAIVAAMGLELKDLFAETPAVSRPSRLKSKSASRPAATAKPAAGPGPIVATYDYRDATGTLVYQVLRYLPKSFKQRRPDPAKPGAWLWHLDATPRILYRLPELLAADPATWAFICEGEKDADALAALGLTATTNPGGALKWAKLSDDSALAGRRVCLIPDLDAAGHRHADDVARRLTGRAAEVKLLDLGTIEDFTGKDVSDWLDSRDSTEPEELARALVEMAESAPTWTPGAVGTSDDVAVVKPLGNPAPVWSPFPLDALPPVLANAAHDITSAIGCDPCFASLPLLASVAGTIGNARAIEVKPGWREPSVLWRAIVGESGTAKSPAVRAVLEPLHDLQATAYRDFRDRQAEYESQHLVYEKALATWKRSKGNEPPEQPVPPSLRHYFVDDVTVEALAAILAEQPRGVLVARDELACWLGDFDRYSASGGGDAPRWLSMWSAGPIKVDRRTKGPLYVARAAVSLCGGIQPQVLARTVGRQYREDGLLARLLLACPPSQVRTWTANTFGGTCAARLRALFVDLSALVGEERDAEMVPAVLLLSDAARALWITFYDHHALRIHEANGDLRAALAKLLGYCARFALVHAVVTRLTEGGPEHVTGENMKAGIVLAEWFANEVERVYARLNERDDDRQQRELVELVHERGGSITTRALMQACRRYRGSAAEAEAALKALVAAGLGVWEREKPAPGGGQPKVTFRLLPSGNGNRTPVPEP